MTKDNAVTRIDAYQCVSRIPRNYDEKNHEMIPQIKVKRKSEASFDREQSK